MLTVKLREHNGHEQVHTAEKVWAEPNPERGHDAYRVHAQPPGAHPDSQLLHFADYGVVYVMNDNGATVAKYWLGYGEAPAVKEPDKLAA